MGQLTGITWAHHTWNPWRGCTKVAAECQHCYAERDAKRNPSVLGKWGPKGVRVVGALDCWTWPQAWNAEVERNLYIENRRVFVNSLADFCEDWTGEVTQAGKSWRFVPGVTLDQCRDAALNVMESCPRLDFIVLTKRPHRIEKCVRPLPNVWVGTSAGTQESAVKFVPSLIKSERGVRFVSCEPLLGPVTLSPWLKSLSWVIVGCESHGTQVGRLNFGGRGLYVASRDGARLTELDVGVWHSRAIRLIEECQKFNVPVFVKQIPVWDGSGGARLVKSFEEFPPEFQVQDFPRR